MTHIQMTEFGELLITLNNGAVVLCGLPSQADGEVLIVTKDKVFLMEKPLPMEAEGQ